jgi:hypothetical protein
LSCVVSASLQGFSPLLLAQLPDSEREGTFLSDIRREPSTYAQQIKVKDNRFKKFCTKKKKKT